MNTPKKPDDSTPPLCANAVDHGDPAMPSAPSPTPARTRALLPSTEAQEEAARTFAHTGDEPSFTVLYLAAQKPMTKAVRRGHVPPSDVEDVVSIAGAAVWFSREHFDGESYGEFAAYSLGITRHKVADWHEENSRYKRIPIKRLRADQSLDNLAVAVGDSPDDVAAAREALSRLSPEEVTVTRMHYEGHSFTEVGKAIGTGREYARQVYIGAVARLRRMMSE